MYSSIIFTQSHLQNSFGFEENFLVLQTGIISTENKDYSVSNEFQSRIIQDGKIIRLSGITATGEPYYIYQKMKQDEIIIHGIIFENGVYTPIRLNEEVYEPEILNVPKTELIFSAKLPHHTYANYPFAISVKVFDAKKNPEALFEHGNGILENVLVSVTITNQNDKAIGTFSGKTDSNGLYRGTHIVRHNVDYPGKYNVKVTVGEGENSISQLYTTFFRGSIQEYFKDNNP